MDRTTFNLTVIESVIQRRNTLKEYLAWVEILKDLAEFEKDQICDVLKYETFEQDEIIIEEGDEGDRLYLIFRGTAVAIKIVNG